MERSHGLRYCERKRAHYIYFPSSMIFRLRGQVITEWVRLDFEIRISDWHWTGLNPKTYFNSKKSILGFFYFHFFGKSLGKWFKELFSRRAAVLHTACTLTHNQHRPMIRNRGKFSLWNPEFWRLESAIPLKESGVPLTDWNPLGLHLLLPQKHSKND